MQVIGGCGYVAEELVLQQRLPLGRGQERLTLSTCKRISAGVCAFVHVRVRVPVIVFSRAATSMALFVMPATYSCVWVC